MSEYKRLAAIIKSGKSVRHNGHVLKSLSDLAEALNPSPEEVDPEAVSEASVLRGKLKAAEKRAQEAETHQSNTAQYLETVLAERDDLHQILSGVAKGELSVTLTDEGFTVATVEPAKPEKADAKKADKPEKAEADK